MPLCMMSLKVRVLATLAIALGACFGFALSHMEGLDALALSNLSETAKDRALLISVSALGLLAVLPALLSVVHRMVLRPLEVLVHCIERLERDGTVPPALRDLRRRRDEVGRLADRFLELLAEAGGETRARREQLHLALGRMPQGLCIFDRDHRLILSNRRFEELYSLAPGNLAPGLRFWELQELCREAGAYSEEEMARVEGEIARQLRSLMPLSSIETVRGGRIVSVTRIPLPEGGWVATYEDITERRNRESRLAYMAHHDALTGLPNRVMLRQELEATLASVSQRRMLAVLCLDLDHFKRVNDSLGHAVGDELLKAVAERLRACVRGSDVVARIGGDEFVILGRDIGTLEEPSTLAERVIDVLGRPFDIAGHRIQTGASVGIAMAPSGGMDPDALLKAADAALYRSKSEGRGSYQCASTLASAQHSDGQPLTTWQH